MVRIVCAFLVGCAAPVGADGTGGGSGASGPSGDTGGAAAGPEVVSVTVACVDAPGAGVVVQVDVEADGPAPWARVAIATADGFEVHPLGDVAGDGTRWRGVLLLGSYVPGASTEIRCDDLPVPVAAVAGGPCLSDGISEPIGLGFEDCAI